MRLSVIVPVYNHARFVEQCLDSIDSQSWGDLEVIVIDDGSKDDSWEKIQRHRFAGNRTVVRITGPNRGAHAALNDGLARSTGDLLTICNSDDFFLPGRLSRLSSALRESPGSEFVFSGARYFDHDGREVTDELPYAQELQRKQAAISSFPSVGYALVLTNVAVSTGNFFFTRSLLRRVGAFRPYKLVHDWDFVLRCLLLTEPVYVADPLYGYRLHANNSFTELMATVAAQECPELMRRFLKAACNRSVKNRLCPSPYNWPHFFDCFIESHHYQPYMAGWDEVDGPFFGWPGLEADAAGATLR